MNWLRRGTLTALSRLRSIAPAENNLNRQVSIPSHGTVERELARQWSQSSLDTGIHTGTGAWAWLLSQSQSSSQGLSLRGVHGTSVAWSSDAAAFSDRSTPPDNADSAHSYPGRGGSSPSRKKVRSSTHLGRCRDQTSEPCKALLLQIERRPWSQSALF